jgi:hypothetical protein
MSANRPSVIGIITPITVSSIIMYIRRVHFLMAALCNVQYYIANGLILLAI